MRCSAQSLESAVRRIDKYFPNAKGVVKFSSPLAHLITAGERLTEDSAGGTLRTRPFCGTTALRAAALS